MRLQNKSQVSISRAKNPRAVPLRPEYWYLIPDTLGLSTAYSIVFFFYCFLSLSHSTAQSAESLVPLFVNPEQLARSEAAEAQKSKKSAPDTGIGYLSDTLSLPFIDDFSKISGLWVDDNAYINSTFAIAPPTIGVATLDGVNPKGKPYDFSSPFTYGFADSLTSKPINLQFTASDSIVMSFYYQPQGLGEAPEGEDSLLLEFYAPLANFWYRVWGAPGSATKPFEQVKISIADTAFLHNGFRMRFRNYATLSGNLDHWNIDYVHLAGKANKIENLQDQAFIYGCPSFINTYTAMPWSHFKNNPSGNMKNSVVLDLRHFYIVDNIINSTYLVYNKTTDALVLLSSSESKGSTPVTSGNPFTVQHFVNGGTNNFVFPVNADERAFFSIANTTNCNPDDNRFNDTIYSTQVFDSYYALDDGSAERVYKLIGDGNKLAYKFDLSQQDSLKGISIYFPYMLEPSQPNTIKLMVWGDNGGLPGSVIYQGIFESPVYTDKLNNMHRFELPSPVAVSGTIYIGFSQKKPTNSTFVYTYVGFDLNINNQSRIFLNPSGTWYNTSNAGSLMIRPDFGTPVPVAHVKESVALHKSMDFIPYPNPAHSRVTIISSGTEVLSASDVQLFDLTGRMVFAERIYRNSDINISGLSPGIYVMRLIDAGGNNTVMKKLIIQR